MSAPTGNNNNVPSRKRPAPAIPIGGTAVSSSGRGGSGAGRGGGRPAAVPIGGRLAAVIKVEQVSSNNRIKTEQYSGSSTTGVNNNNNKSTVLKTKFLKMFDEPAYNKDGVPNSILKDRFPHDFTELVPIINELLTENRLSMNKNSIGELFYTIVSSDIASKLVGVDAATRLVYQMIQKSDNMGIWTKTIRTQTNIEQQKLNKIFNLLEQRKLIKPVKSVSAKSKKIYMCYDIVPSKELTGGVWYSDLEFDHEFINELRAFVIQCIRRINNGTGVSIKQILDKIKQGNVSKVQLSVNEVSQLVETLIYDNIVEESSGGAAAAAVADEVLFVPAPRVTPLSEFKWWDSVLTTDFKYRTIKFEDTITLTPHEPHYQTG